MQSHLNRIERDGFSLLPGVLDTTEAERLAGELSAALDQNRGEATAVRSSAGTVYAARNVLEIFPEADRVWRRPTTVELLTTVLGPRCGLVRALFFDKPPERTWSLSWHKDLSIAVADNTLPSASFSRPTTKAGVPHVIAPVELLRQMLTLRYHLDEVTDENGPLQVVPGSHRDAEPTSTDDAATETIHAAPGDVLAMRPLLSHASGNSSPETTRHRRVLHLEFAASPELPDGFAWHEFRGL